MSSSAITTGRWPPQWRSRSCCCSPAPSRSTSTTTCASSRPELNGTALFRGAVLGVVLRHRAAVSADPGADRLLLQRLPAGQRMGRLLHCLVRSAAAQPPAAAGGATVARGRGGRLERRGAAPHAGWDRAGAACALL